MTSVPLINVYNPDDPTKPEKEKVPLPPVFQAPIRYDIVHFVFSNIAKNIRQAHGVDRNAGMKHSGESWGTGRAVSRIPRVSGSGTHRSGQGAFANSVRKGRMFAPLKIWRRWHRRVNIRQKRHASASAIAASGYTALVMARGHKVDAIPEIPLVVEDKLENYEKTKEAIAFLKRIGAYADIEKVMKSKRLRSGKGKMRNKRYKIRKGPLVIYANKAVKLIKAFRNIPGVDTCNVYQLNLKQLAPGGQLGAFKALREIFGTKSIEAKFKKGYELQKPLLTNADLARIINSSEIQEAIRPPLQNKPKHMVQKKNPLRNRAFMDTLNPDAKPMKEAAKIANDARRKKRKEELGKKRELTKVQRDEIKKRKANSKKWIREVQKELYDVAEADKIKYKPPKEVEEIEPEGEEEEEDDA